jgi:RNA polymerase sigma-54 factor
MRLDSRPETGLAQRQGLGLRARQWLETLVLPGPALAASLAARAADNPFLRAGLALRPGPSAAGPYAAGPYAAGPGAAGAGEAGPIGSGPGDWGQWETGPGQAGPGGSGLGPSLFGHVLAALPLVTRGADRAIALRLTEALGETGLLVEPLEEIAAELGLPLGRVAAVLARLQRIEPAGLFARSLAECLALQLCARGLFDETAVAVLARLDGLAGSDAEGFARRHGLDPDRVGRLWPVLARLSASPAAAFAEPAPALRPDLAFERRPEGWQAVVLAEAQPRLALCPDAFRRALARAPDAAQRDRTRRQWQEAQDLARALAGRAATLARLGQILVLAQRAGLDSGFRARAPLTRREVAARLGLHEATVGRLVQQRLALVGGRMVPLSWFFERPQPAATAPGATRSAVLAALRALIEAEGGAAKLSDAELARRLAAQGLSLSRRRLGKYRQLLGLPARRRGGAGATAAGPPATGSAPPGTSAPGRAALGRAATRSAAPQGRPEGPAAPARGRQRDSAEPRRRR